MQIHKATENDLQPIKQLLATYDLVIDDIDLSQQNFIVVYQDNQLIGVAALEVFNPLGLLRSVALDSEYQGIGLSRKMCDSLFTLAKTKQCSSIYLLTQSAQAYFENLGFKLIDREKAPKSIKKTRQFSSLCPDDVAVMVKHLV